MANREALRHFSRLPRRRADGDGGRPDRQKANASGDDHTTSTCQTAPGGRKGGDPVQDVVTDSLALDVRRAALFAGLDEAASTRILSAARRRSATPDEILFRQGEPSEQVLLLVHGLVRMSQSVSGGAQATLRLMRAGELIGCVAAIRGFPYPATATTLEESHLLSWATSDFLELMKSQPALTQNVLDIVGDRTREMVEHIGDLSRKTLEERLAAALLRLSRQAGVVTDGRMQIKASNAREDLAALAGAGYFTISRTLSDWQKQGIIRNGRHRIVIIDELRLETIATGGA